MTAERPPVLEVKDLAVDYGSVRVLDGLSLSLRAGQVVGVVGESGSGKTTLAKTVLRTVEVAQGRVLVGGEDITRLRGAGLRRWRRAGAVQYVFQDPLRSLDPGVRVTDSIAEGLRIAGVPAAAAKERFDAAVQAVDLDAELLERLPAGLSGGQRQRVAIARALVVQPRLLVLDEPVSALDAASRDRVVQSLIALRRARGQELGMLVISHDIGSLAALSDRLVVLHHGRIVENGPTAQVVAKPQHPYTRRLIESVPVIDVRYPNRPAPIARS
ncbi:ABC transporter ATP-binding protein [Microbacterium sp. ARD32]|uniref:ABC transporter ATP-binding protein n=1 Tax=Microbacterium sp. ARD32 TaxID=2962577 RepID=UPI00288213E8|nr:ABC transporter ATP-binding protein [Microbacterium sp. ARD32]MDT0158740.1 ABC transporter ATP-binding protein [Microbacterium sp. ARD32]